MKKIVLISSFFLVLFISYSQEFKKIKHLKCINKMPLYFDSLSELDTIFILFQESKIDNFEQYKNNIYSKYSTRSYNFLKNIHFPIEIYDTENFTKINFKKPLILYKGKNFICKNMYRTIDVYFMNKYYNEIFLEYFKSKKTIFIIDLDNKKQNVFKIVQVNQPEIIKD